jgi:Uma2 family endonuclease
VAVSNPDLDRENASLYAEANVKEYWVVLGSEKKVEVYRRPEMGRYLEKSVVGVNDTLVCGSIPSVRVRLGELFV